MTQFLLEVGEKKSTAAKNIPCTQRNTGLDCFECNIQVDFTMLKYSWHCIIIVDFSTINSSWKYIFTVGMCIDGDIKIYIEILYKILNYSHKHYIYKQFQN